MTADPSTHRLLAIEANNSTWEILGKPRDQISPEEAEEMTRRAYAAAYHWQRAEASTPANSARADWLLSRVWAVRGVGDQAMRYARRCMATCEASSLADFDVAYAHEALARAYACLGQASEARQHKESATHVPIADPEDKAVVDGDLASEPWFGIS
jgi:hypothetical protein